MPEQINTKRVDELIRTLRNGMPTEQERDEIADKLQIMRNEMLELQRVLNMLQEGLRPPQP
jgi:Zn-dependent M16 (insulinase) family peptidase